MAPHAGQMSHAGVNVMSAAKPPAEEETTIGRMKCVLVGDGAVGKTSLVVSYTTNGYPTEYVPTAFDNFNVRVTVDNQPIVLQLCDTAGQDDFDALRPLCYPGTDIFLLCFSVVSPTSFYNIRDKWLPEIRHHCPAASLILVGTQCDLRSDVKVLIELASYREQPISELQAQEMAHAIGAESYLESSALTQKNLKEVFDTAIVLGLQKSYHHQLDKRKTTNNNNNNVPARSFSKYKLMKMPSNRRCEQRIDMVDNTYYPCKMDKTGKWWKKMCCFS